MREFFAVEKGQKKYRQERLDPFILAKEFEKEGTDPVERETRRLCQVLEQEKPVVFPDERIAFTRTVTNIPEIFTRVIACAEKAAKLRKAEEKALAPRKGRGLQHKRELRPAYERGLRGKKNTACGAESGL